MESKTMKKLVYLDLAEAETKLLTTLKDDVHKLRAMEMFNVSSEEVTLEMRRMAKHENYVRMYGSIQLEDKCKK